MGFAFRDFWICCKLYGFLLSVLFVDIVRGLRRCSGLLRFVMFAEGIISVSGSVLLSCHYSSLPVWCSVRVAF